jgi:hypothetical protein
VGLPASRPLGPAGLAAGAPGLVLGLAGAIAGAAAGAPGLVLGLGGAMAGAAAGAPGLVLGLGGAMARACAGSMAGEGLVARAPGESRFSVT